MTTLSPQPDDGQTTASNGQGTTPEQEGNAELVHDAGASGSPLPAERVALLVVRLEQGPLVRGEKARLAKEWGVKQVQVARAVEAAQAIVEGRRGPDLAKVLAHDLVHEAAALSAQLDRDLASPKLTDEEKDARLKRALSVGSFKLKIAAALGKLHGGGRLLVMTPEPPPPPEPRKSLAERIGARKG